MKALIAVALSVASCAGCSQVQLAAPSPPDQSTITISVLVLTYVTEQPIASAQLFVDGAPAGYTSGEGTMAVQASRGEELTMQAGADGYHLSPIVTATPYAAERWTFYLEHLER